MNVGDYVRFYNRSWAEIGQIVDEVEDSHLKVVKCRDGFYDLDNFIKSSPNIIDLIEVGDYVNGLKITLINEPSMANCNKRLLYVEDEEGYLIKMFDKQDIESIVTKEQFESMKYKVGE